MTMTTVTTIPTLVTCCVLGAQESSRVTPPQNPVGQILLEMLKRRLKEMKWLDPDCTLVHSGASIQTPVSLFKTKQF